MTPFARGTALHAGDPGDLDALVALRSRAIGAVRSPRYGARELAAWNAWPMAALADALASQDVVVATEDGGIVGFAWASAGPGPHLRSLYVDPPAAARGLGRLLLSCVEDAVRRSSASLLLVAATPNAEGFYRARSYRAEGEFEVVGNDGGGPVVLPLVKMARDLNGALRGCD